MAGEQRRRSLYLVDCRRGRQAVHEPGRVEAGGLVEVEFVQTHISIFRCDSLYQRRLATLSRPHETHHRGVRERLTDHGSQRTREVGRMLGHLLVKVASNCLLHKRPIAAYAYGQLPVKRASDCRFKRNGTV